MSYDSSTLKIDIDLSMKYKQDIPYYPVFKPPRILRPWA